MKVRATTYAFIVSFLIWIFTLVIGFIPGIFPPSNSELGFWIFVISEILAFIFIIITIGIVFKKSDSGNAILLVLATMGLQILPLINKILISQSGTQYQYIALATSIVWFIIFIAIFFSIDLLNLKISKAFTKIQGTTIEVVDESTFIENGKFLGANKKKEEK